MRKILLFAALLLMQIQMKAQNLNPGDIVLIGYAADTGTSTTIYNEFSLVPLVNLEAGTKIYFTDAGYNTVDADFMGTGLNDEILLRYIVPAGGVSAGTVFTVTEESIPPDYTVISGSKFGNDFNGLISLPNAGDQITVFQSTDDETSAATFGNANFSAIFMLTGSSLSFTALSVGKANINPAVNVDNLTNLAPGLTDGANAIAVGSGPLEADESDNARYTGIISGTREEILAAVCNLANWSRHDAAFGNDLAFGTTPNGWTTNGAAEFDLLGIPENELPIISLYPNPAGNYVQIKNEAAIIMEKISIYDIKGLLVSEMKNPGNMIDITGLSHGLYFINLETEGGIITKKLVKR